MQVLKTYKLKPDHEIWMLVVCAVIMQPRNGLVQWNVLCMKYKWNMIAERVVSVILGCGDDNNWMKKERTGVKNILNRWIGF